MKSPLHIFAHGAAIPISTGSSVTSSVLRRTRHGVQLVVEAVIAAILPLIAINMLLYALMHMITLPGTTMMGRSVGLQSRSSISQAIAAAEQDTQIELANGTVLSMSEVTGATYDEAALWQSLRAVDSFWDLPLFKLATGSILNHQPPLEFNATTVNKQLGQYIEPIDTSPVNAQLIRQADGQFSIKEAVAGQMLTADIATQQLKTKLENLSRPDSIELKPSIVPAALTTDDLRPSQTAANIWLQSDGIEFWYQDKKVAQITGALLSDMLVQSAADPALLTLEAEAFERWLDQYLRPEVNMLPTPTRIEGGTTKQAGTSGQQIAYAELIQDIEKLLNSPAAPKQINVQTTDWQPITITDGVYPKNQQGMQALIADYNERTYGDYAVVFQQLRGGDFRARHEAFTPIVPASTYKAFLAYAVLHTIETTDLELSSPIRGTTIERCLFIMIHYSTNKCALSFLSSIGYDRVDEILHEAGYLDTTLNNPTQKDNKFTTPYDEFKLMRDYYNGSLLNTKHNDMMLELFKNQKYRSGIPAAVAPNVVADKIGFLGSYTHDAAIVYGEDADYILVIMTNGGSFWSINSLAKDIHELFTE